MLKEYIQLLRISNVFTVPPDILAGYFLFSINSMQTITQNQNLYVLILSSMFLYLGGIVSNDVFDVKIDRLERPNRPLASNKINIKNAKIFCFALFGTGISLAILSNLLSIIVSLLLTVGIISYNYSIKNGFFRSYFMGGIRSLNVFYGGTGAFVFTNSYNIFSINDYLLHIFPSDFFLIICSLIIVFCHVFILTLISNKETEREFLKSKGLVLNLKRILILYLIIIISMSCILLIYLPFKLFFVISIVFFSVCVTVVFVKVLIKKQQRQKAQKKGHHLFQFDNKDMSFIVKNMIILLILLDSSFVFGSTGLIYGIISSLLIIPCILIGKRIKMT